MSHFSTRISLTTFLPYMFSLDFLLLSDSARLYIMQSMSTTQSTMLFSFPDLTNTTSMTPCTMSDHSTRKEAM